jgi:hypothetical protein
MMVGIYITRAVPYYSRIALFYLLKELLTVLLFLHKDLFYLITLSHYNSLKLRDMFGTVEFIIVIVEVG